MGRSWLSRWRQDCSPKWERLMLLKHELPLFVVLGCWNGYQGLFDLTHWYFSHFLFLPFYLLLGFLIFNLWLLHINKKNMWLFLHHFILSDKLHLCFSNWVDGMMYLMCFNYCLNRVKFGLGWYWGNIARRIKSCNHAAGISSLYRNFAASNPFYM